MSNNSEELKKLYAKGRTYKIPAKPKAGQEQAILVFVPVGLEQMAYINMEKGQPTTEMAENANKLIATSLGVTVEEAAKVPMYMIEDIMEAIIDVNDFDNQDKDKVGTIRKAALENIDGEENKQDKPISE